MTELETKIQKAAQAYYTDGSSELSDEDFDRLIEQLKVENPESPLLKKTGWGYSVESDSTPGMKYKHRYGIAGSLDKCRTWEEVKPIFRNQLVDVSLKLDGISVLLYYRNGELYQALTRGNGHIGIDITEKIRCIKSVPDDIDSQFTGAIRGEIVMSFDNFEKFKKLHSEAKNPRNTVAGLINGKEITEEITLLDVVVYSIVGCENNYANYKFMRIENVRSWLNFWFRYLAPNTEIKMVESAIAEDFPHIKDTLYADAGNDVLYGGNGNDSLFGGDGDDTLYGDAGDDYLEAGNVTDTLYGGVGNDTFVGGEGINYMYGEEGDDTFYGGNALNYMYGGDGDDNFTGGELADYIEGGAGNDTMNGGNGSNEMYGGDGVNTIYGGAGNDIIYSGDNGSFLYGGDGDDQIYAGGGADVLDGGAGNDYLQGDHGGDTYVFGIGYDIDTINASADLNTILIHGYTAADMHNTRMANNDLVIDFGIDTGDRLIIQGFFNFNSNRDFNFVFDDETVLGQHDIQAVSAPIYGTDADEWLSVQGNDDGIIYAGAGNDGLSGGSGNDELYGEDGDDTLYGNDGNDTLDGVTGNDTLCGGNGTDTYIFAKGYGNDTINEWGSDRSIVKLTDINSDEVTITDQWGSNLVVSINGTDDTLVISNFKWGQATYSFEFADGAIATVNKDTWKLEFSKLPDILEMSEDELVQENADILSEIYADDSLTSDLLTESDSTVISDISDSVSVTDESDEVTDQTDIQVMILTENMSAFANEDNVFDNADVFEPTDDMSMMNQLLVGSQVQ